MGKSTVEIIELFEYQKSPIRFIMKSNQTLIRKTLMEHINHTLQHIGIKDKNITLNNVLKDESPTELVTTYQKGR
ncbi:transposase [Streptococcus pyogenes JRS4]|uniref:Transposase n=3 Tax=Streptococcus pyogenes TaxID=1314 RepID=A0A4U7HW10_STRPY|nr:Transposase [Streptococcus pyogenes MGAS10394]AAZ51686.1 transposase [Streptococcus pyogenes MGAS5005]ABF32297.1 transposase [Streptococcus pyogenes MGAS9429]ABF34189.1 Transposase [Streptococcus pyogenes MGAS10270]ABF36119.1 Transposase [Streptococcus pyogenes MGAS2096]ACI61332.1 transposase [Streptococcus pyogenes NZ131]AGQ28556.1 transposase [Streptococcus pyogenes HSC5]AIG47152.1 transposase [Streptococcus pyogenes STAB902]AIG49035.1 transposase [Streptococcus pyogenes STAB1102]AIG5